MRQIKRFFAAAAQVMDYMEYCQVSWQGEFINADNKSALILGDADKPYFGLSSTQKQKRLNELSERMTSRAKRHHVFMPEL